MILPATFKLDREAIIAATKDTITQSEIMTRASCPRKWYYRYVLKLNRLGTPNYHLIYGTMMHAALAKLYSNKLHNVSPKEYPIEVDQIAVPENVVLTPDDKANIELARMKVQIAFNAYRRHYFKYDSTLRVESVEDIYEYSHKGIKLTGRLDMVANPKKTDGIFVWDWKTAGRFDLNMLDAWSFRFQFLYYCWLYWKITDRKPSGIMVNGLGKTMLKPRQVDKKTKQKETVRQYLDRVKVDFREHRERFFYRQRMPLMKGILERFEREILDPHVESFLLLGQRAVANNTVKVLASSMNTSCCHLYGSFCEYLPLCKDGMGMMNEFYKRDDKHEELSVETETEIGQS